MFGGMAHRENEPPTWRAELAMAIAGPMTSLAHGVNQLPVVENGRLVGLLRREDLVKWLTLHSRQPADGGLQAHQRGRAQLS